MSSLPLEVHEVLEQEYVSMYGPLEEIAPTYTPDQIVDAAWAVSILDACGLPAVATTKESVAEQLNRFVAEIPPALAESPALTSTGRSLLESHGKRSDALPELNRRIVDDAFTGAVTPLRDLRLARVYAALHRRDAADPAKGRTALCISGGGIPSSAFALGILQGLASAKVLDKFDYLSTVSGGGYVGSWLSSWARRHPHGISGVQEDLAAADPTAVGARSAGDEERPSLWRVSADVRIQPEPKPVKNLRGAGKHLMSADAWYIAGLYFRNLLLNLLVIIPIVTALLALPRAYAWLARTTFFTHEWTFLAAMVVFLAMAFGYVGLQRPVPFEPPRKTPGDTSLLWFCILPLVGAAISLSLFWADVAPDPDERNNPLLPVFAMAAIAVITVWPFVLYQRRLGMAFRSAPRTHYATEREWRLHLLHKAQLELLGAVLGFAIAGALLPLLAVRVFSSPLQLSSPRSALYIVFAVPAVLFVFFIQINVFLAVSSRRNEDQDREWWSRVASWLLVTATVWIAIGAITLFGPAAFYYAPEIFASVGGVSALISAVLGASGGKSGLADALVGLTSERRTPEERGKWAAVARAAVGLAVPIFIVTLLCFCTIATTWVANELALTRGNRESDRAADAPAMGQVADPRYGRLLSHLATVYRTSGAELAAISLLALVGLSLSRTLGMEKLSMHTFYRNRLIRAYLGAARYERRPNPVTGFDDRDNLPIYQLRPELLWPTNLKDPQRFFTALLEGKRAGGTSLSGQTLERRKLAKFLWESLSESTRLQVETGVSASAIDAVIQDVNGILLNEAKLLEKEVSLPDDFWTKTRPGQIPYPALTRNRAVLDYYFSDVLTPAPRPADAAAGTPRVVGDPHVTEGPRRAPLHVLNASVHLHSDGETSIGPLMLSPYDSGGLFLGYRDSRSYAGTITLGTAMTISSAATGATQASLPSLLLTFLSARPEWWLGNPATPTYLSLAPPSQLGALLAEAMGRTSAAYEWIHVSDGGHFDNLGLYEMVLRRCHSIVVIDAGPDPKFISADLGHAIRKIRNDLGVPIDVVNRFMSPRGEKGEPTEGKYIATANIGYSAADGADARDGRLIILKPGFYTDPFFPHDVVNYALASPDFPHETTTEFSDAQFDAYRTLGRHVVNEICANYPDRTHAGPRAPIARQFHSVGEFAAFVSAKAVIAPRLRPEEVIADAILRLRSGA